MSVDALNDAFAEYQSSNERMATIACELVARTILGLFPKSRYLLVETTDQDFSGSLVACSVTDADLNVLSDKMFHAADYEVGPEWQLDGVLGLLDDSNNSIWSEFEKVDSDRRSNQRLDLVSIILSVLAHSDETAVDEAVDLPWWAGHDAPADWDGTQPLQ